MAAGTRPPGGRTRTPTRSHLLQRKLICPRRWGSSGHKISPRGECTLGIPPILAPFETGSDAGETCFSERREATGGFRHLILLDKNRTTTVNKRISGNITQGGKVDKQTSVGIDNVFPLCL